MDQMIALQLAKSIAHGEVWNHVCLSPKDAKGRTMIETEHGTLTILIDSRMPSDWFWLGWTPAA